MQNPDIARLFDEVADLLEIQSQNPFRVRAYRNAARVVRDFPRPLQEEVRRAADLTEIPGIGEDLAEKIAAIVTTAGCNQRAMPKGDVGVFDAGVTVR